MALPQVSECWFSDFSFWNCCILHMQSCFDVKYSRERCCNVGPPLTDMEIKTLSTGDLTCNCSVTHDTYLCNTRKDVILRYSLFSGLTVEKDASGNATGLIISKGEDLMPVSVEEMGKCPLGVLSLLIYMAGVTSRLLPGLSSLFRASMRYIRAAFDIILTRLNDVLEDGWVWIFQLLNTIKPNGKVRGACSEIGEHEVTIHKGITEYLRTGVAFPLDAAHDFIHGSASNCSANSPCCSIGLASVVPRCCLAPATTALAISQLIDDDKTQAQYLRQVGIYLGALDSRTRLTTLLSSKWPLLELFKDTSSVLVRTAPLLELLDFKHDVPEMSSVTFQMHISRSTEMVSNAIRLNRFSFCTDGLLARVVASVAVACHRQGCGGWHFSLLEAGPHLGDCSLLATVLLRSVKVRHRIVAVEAQPEIAKLMKRTVYENNWGDMIDVVAMALGAKSGSFMDLTFAEGMSGQASFRWDAYMTRMNTWPHQRPGNPTTARTLRVPIVALDDLWPTDQQLHILKVTVSGAEMEVLRGAKSFLATDKWCAVLMVVKLLMTGWQGLASAQELMDIFHAGGRDVDILVGDAWGEPIRMRTASELASLDKTHPTLHHMTILSTAPSCSFIRGIFSESFQREITPYFANMYAPSPPTDGPVLLSVKSSSGL